ncbi:hypothetical protein RND81_01G019300 [Saponaria officinalis]|uniref:Endonuclease/exonuclease/phosphatase domain-containing protein n=1 Tax=Saponaria officinalis TaxID=3572 RepID=A0AAW1NBU0_SAPOF
MIMSAWNIRGFNRPMKHSEVSNFLASNKVDFCGLLETRVKQNKSSSILRKFGVYSSFCNYTSHCNGKIWLLWRSTTTQVTILGEHPQVVHCHVKHFATNRKFYVSVVYGSNNAAERMSLWDSLSTFAATVGAWIVMGDFNVVRYDHERISHVPPNSSDLLEFNSCILDCGLMDMSCSGFLQTSAQFLSPGLSDHSPSLITFHEDPLPVRRFSFLNCWAAHPHFLKVVADAWGCVIRGTPMFRLMRKLQNVKRGLKQLHHQHYADIGRRVQAKKEELANCYTALLENPLSDLLIQKEKCASDAYWKIKEAETKILRQRAKLHEMKHGDINSQYFFAKIKERKQSQIIGAIQGHTGQDHVGLKQVGDVFVEYYQFFLGSSVPVKDIDQTILAKGNMIEADDFDTLLRPVSRIEIKNALFGIGSNKSPGMDGFSSGFFKAAWAIIEDDFCCAVEDFFKTSFMPKQANTTLVSLIPKKPVPQTVKDFRPISCCSVVYKTVSRILTGRLEGVMPKLVGEE